MAILSTHRLQQGPWGHWHEQYVTIERTVAEHNESRTVYNMRVVESDIPRLIGQVSRYVEKRLDPAAFGAEIGLTGDACK